MAFLLDTFKERLSSDDTEGFDDMEYMIGNTSGMDIGQVPGPLDQRIGRMAQIGGGIMEIQITNPATFQIDRPELMNVISQLGFDDITLHGDPNIGFTGAYATRGQGVQGYNIVHRYFKRYLEQMAAFRWEMTNQRDLFDVGYVNMHASNETIPAREEQIASDVSVDPFGVQIKEVYQPSADQTEDDGDSKGVNIYENKEFLENLFDYLVKQEYDPYQIYGLFSELAPGFKEKWNNAQEEVANKYYENLSSEQKVGVLQTAVSADQGVQQAYRKKLEEEELGFEIQVPDPQNPNQVHTYNLLDDIAPNRIRGLSNFMYELTEKEQVPNPLMTGQSYDISTENVEKVKEALENVIDNVWYLETGDGLSLQGKIAGLTNRIDELDEGRITQEAADLEMEEHARKALAGDEDYYEDEVKNLDLVDRLIRQTNIGREIDKESTMFFHVIPAWMQATDREVPKFIWESTLRQSVRESDEVEGDDPYFKNWDEFEAFLDERRENELDVIAAVGICYIWGHWTQAKDRFELDAFKQTVLKSDEYEKPELKDGEEGEYTWIEWMNKFGLKLNIEAMFGGPGELRRVWRPKDIAIACHAINMQARKDLDDYDENLVKFTIDMEHTASYGVDPWNEMERLIHNEKKLAEKYPGLRIDPKKPLAEIVKTYHLTKPGWEQQQGHRHGPFSRGDETLYYWLYKMVENGFARNPEDEARIIFEVGGEYHEEMYVTRVAMDMIQQNIKPKELDEIVNEIPMDGEYETVEQELVARFFGMDKGSYNREWAKIEEHAFDPLDGLLEARGFDETWSGQGAIEQGQARPQEWKSEEYR